MGQSTSGGERWIWHPWRTIKRIASYVAYSWLVFVDRITTSRTLNILARWEAYNRFAPLFTILLVIYTALLGDWRLKAYKHPVLFEPPYHPNIRVGSDVPVFTGIAAVLWFIFTVIPQHYSLKDKRVWWFLVVIVRFGIVAALGVSAWLQSTYMPRPLDSCENAYIWPDTADVPKGTPTMWQILHETNKFGQEVAACPWMRSWWRFTIAMM
ncbi:hypothetical protein FQN51_004807 [Onygenales sp. PD_10]|nr:hypothetical protein FQN51_004807 [Onygenales sp. PD_10]